MATARIYENNYAHYHARTSSFKIWKEHASYNYIFLLLLCFYWWDW